MNKSVVIQFVYIVAALLLPYVATYAQESSNSVSHLEINNNIQIKYKESLQIEISSKGINHISFWPYKIEKIIGDTSMYTANTGESTSGSNLFITSKVASGNKFNISAMLTNGKTIDLACSIIESTEPKIIELDFISKANSKTEINFLAREMINAMQKGVTGRYYVRPVKETIILAETKDYKLKQINNYQHDKLFGAILVIQNKRKHSIFLKPWEVVSHFRDVDAYALESQMILPKGIVKAYVVFRRREE